jgi:hypothetical protein
VIAGAALVLAGCAAPRRRAPMPVPSELASRYAVAWAERNDKAAGVEGDLSIWTTVGDNRIPGAQAKLALQSPDAFRVRVSSLFGTALDIGARGDSVMAYFPARRMGMRLDANRDAIGLAQPGRIMVRALGGLWRPPDAAWDQARDEEDLMVARWVEEGDTIALGVDATGLPARVTVMHPGSRAVHATYRSWDRSQGVAWPSWIEFQDEDGEVQVTTKVTRVNFTTQLDPGRLTVAIPRDADRLTMAELRRLIQRLGTF